jgi:hypothetical protein
MRQAMPPITAQAADLKQRLQRDHDNPQKPRLQMLYLLASGQTHERQEMAHLLGVHRNTTGRWLALYAAGGLDALLATYVPPRQTRLPHARGARQPRAGAPPARRLCLV